MTLNKDDMEQAELKLKHAVLNSEGGKFVNSFELKNMRSVTIIINHYESVNFLHAAIKQIRKYVHPEIQQKIIVADQSSKETFLGLERTYEWNTDIEITWLRQPLWSGYGIDFLMRYGNIKSDYVCQLHADAFPISSSWLSLPIKLIEENNYSFVGQLQFISKLTDSIYPPSRGFFCMAQCFNVAKTKTYKDLSMFAGFTRFHNRPQSGLEWASNSWEQWAQDNYHERGSDDDVVAFHWQDANTSQDKLGLAITGFIESSFGRVIEDIVFHFGSANEARGVMSSMPELYRRYTRKIAEGYTDELIEEMVSLAKANQPPQQEILRRNHWCGKTKTSTPPSEALNKRIEELKHE
jgi:hypothetical protein